MAEFPPLPRQVARAILSLEVEIAGGMLATARIIEAVNSGLDHRFHVSPDSVGKTAAILQLTTDKMENWPPGREWGIENHQWNHPGTPPGGRYKRGLDRMGCY